MKGKIAKKKNIIIDKIISFCLIIIALIIVFFDAIIKGIKFFIKIIATKIYRILKRQEEIKKEEVALDKKNSKKTYYK